MKQVSELKYQGSYPMKMKRRYLGVDMNREGEECFENRVYMYLGPIRLDITDYNAAQVKLIVQKLDLMGLTREKDND
jgi:hypothetical protein